MQTASDTEESLNWRRWLAVWMCAGLVLRVLCMMYPREADDDTAAYLQLGQNLLHHGTYGFMDDGTVNPALFRLPGYPIFLALLGGHMHLIFAVQCVVDLLGCLLVATCVRRFCGEKAGLWALALGTMCLFTATYASTALTESLSVFAVAAGIYCLGEVVRRGEDAGLRDLLPLAGCAALAMLLRPDGAILTIAVVAALLVYGRAGLANALRRAALFLLLACIPLMPWAVRNAITFGVFEPLAPRHVNDPGERVNLGFYRWLRTWSVEFESTCLVFWHVGAETIDLGSLPARAFDSDAQRSETAALIAAYNVHHDVDEALDRRFAALAAQRIREHPLRYFGWVPALRVADMALRPRTEGLALPIDWWRWREHPAGSAAAAGLGLLNLLYVGAAIGGLVRRPPLMMFMLTYLVLRCVLLATLENPEPRYTLEMFPVVFVLGAAGLARIRQRINLEAPTQAVSVS